MTIKKVGVNSFVLLLFGLLFFGSYFVLVLSPKTAKAATTPRIYVQSSKTSFLTTENVTATVIIDGGDQAFTSFKADVALTNLSIISGPTLSPSIANWQTQPSSSSLNFFGGVQGTTTNIAVYSVILKPTRAGTASINVSSGAIYQVQGDGMTIIDILSSQEGATYTVTTPPSTPAPAPAPTPAPTSPDTPTDTPTDAPTESSSSTPTSTSQSSVPVAPTPEKATVTPPPATTSGNVVIPTAVATTSSAQPKGYLWWGAWISFFIGVSSAIAVLVIKEVKMR